MLPFRPVVHFLLSPQPGVSIPQNPLDSHVLPSPYVPIRKSYTLREDGSIQKTGYPFVHEFASHEVIFDPKDISSLLEPIRSFAQLGGCMVKGTLNRPLRRESRKGSTDADSFTQWVCLDIDGIEGYKTIDDFLRKIGFDDVDYILQWSNSMGIESQTDLRAHVFMLLDEPAHPKVLKALLQHINLQLLGDQVELTKTNNALRWPLDITTCQNDKLIYITPPLLGPGIPDPFPNNDRITLQTRRRRALTLPQNIPSPEAVRKQTHEKIQELRERIGLPRRRDTSFKIQDGVEYLVKPDSAILTGVKNERGFVYMNLNGGDSWAYYHPENDPTFIFNFKGEPTYRTEDLLPEYWRKHKHLAEETKRIYEESQMYRTAPDGRVYLAFRDFNTSAYYNGFYDTQTKQLELAQAKSEAQIRQFMKLHNQFLGECIPDWRIQWQPNNPVVLDVQGKIINTFQPSSFMSAPPLSPPVTAIPPTIHKVIDHVLNHDAPTIDHFINWLACIVQFRTRTGTAWVWQGTEGTGKGVLYHSVLTPLFGLQNVVAKRMEEIESEFTGFMEGKFIVFIDEIEITKNVYHAKVVAKFKNLIVEPWISIRRMYTLPYMAPNYANLIFASNKTASVYVPSNDRRFNVGGYQKTPIKLSAFEIETLIPRELPAFYSYLMAYKADPDRARRPQPSAARDKLIHINKTALDSVSEALLNGDLEFFWDHLNTEDRKNSTMSPLTAIRYNPFRDLVVDIVTNQTNKLTREELHIIYDWCVGDIPSGPHKFSSLLKHKGIHIGQVWKNNRNVRGINVNWVYSPQWLAQAQLEIQNGSV